MSFKIFIFIFLIYNVSCQFSIVEEPSQHSELHQVNETTNIFILHTNLTKEQVELLLHPLPENKEEGNETLTPEEKAARKARKKELKRIKKELKNAKKQKEKEEAEKVQEEKLNNNTEQKNETNKELISEKELNNNYVSSDNKFNENDNITIQKIEMSNNIEITEINFLSQKKESKINLINCILSFFLLLSFIVIFLLSTQYRNISKQIGKKSKNFVNYFLFKENNVILG